MQRLAVTVTLITIRHRTMDLDRELVERFLTRRSEAAFTTLYRRHAAAVYGLALRLAGHTAAEDVAQDAWIRAVHGLAGFKGQSTLRTWLCGIVVNCCRERWRSAAREETRATEGTPASPDPSSSLDVHAALERLSAGYRAVVVLHDVFGHTHREIADILGIQEGTSKSQLARGRQVMRELLKGKTYAG
jgi:RNA polymerase sigma-70 factor (ECF subfamily)